MAANDVRTAEHAFALETLLACVRQQGLLCGPREAIDAARLLQAMAAAAGQQAERTEVSTWLNDEAMQRRWRLRLRPIFCTSLADQAKFDAAFGLWVTQVEQRDQLGQKPGPKKTEQPAKGQNPPKPAPDDKTPPTGDPLSQPWRTRLVRYAQSPGLRLTVLLWVLACVLWAAFDADRQRSASNQADARSEPAASWFEGWSRIDLSRLRVQEPISEPPAPEPPVAKKTTPLAGNVFSTQQTSIQRQEEVAHDRLRAELVGVPLALAGLLLFGVLMPIEWLSRHRRKSLTTLYLDDGALSQEALRVAPQLEPDIAGMLNRHQSLRESGLETQHGHNLARSAQGGAGRRLDMRKTVLASLRRGGVPSLHWRMPKYRPSYLMLLDVSDSLDAAHQMQPNARLFFYWAQRLRHEGIDVELRAFQRTDAGPAQSQPLGDQAIWRDDVPSLPLNALPDPPLGQRLIVVSDGQVLVQASGQHAGQHANHLQSWVHSAGWHRWPQRVLFTPREPRHWGHTEHLLEAPLPGSDEPLMLVLPLDEPALRAWAQAMATGNTLEPIVLSEPQRYPLVLHQAERAGDLLAQWVQADQPPSADQLKALLAQLQRYLGANGYLWLSACAVAPLIQWDLMLLLGERVLRGAGAVDERLPYLMSRNYRLLARLPWLKHQQMPAWLRLALIVNLPPAWQQEIRVAVQGLLAPLRPKAPLAGQGQNAGQQPGLALHLGQINAAPKRQNRDAANTQAHESPQQSAAQDYLYLGFMSGMSARELALQAPAAWQAWSRQVLAAAQGRLGPKAWFQRWRQAWAQAWAGGFGAYRHRWRFGGASRGVWVLYGALLTWVGMMLVAQSLPFSKQAQALPPVVRAVLFETVLIKRVVDVQVEAVVASKEPDKPNMNYAIGKSLPRDCAACPELVPILPGSYMRGSPDTEKDRDSDEGPQRRVTINYAFAVGRFEVTFDEWDACVAAKACSHRPSDQGWGRGRRPVIDVSWNDAQQYVRWLTQVSGKPYRLLTEAEWEYVARAGMTTRFFWGDDLNYDQACKYANGYDATGKRVNDYGWDAFKCDDGEAKTAEVGRYAKNAFGLADTSGNVREWVQDCWQSGYTSAPLDGSAYVAGKCDGRVLRGGSWGSFPGLLRSAYRDDITPDYRDDSFGLRVARMLP